MARSIYGLLAGIGAGLVLLGSASAATPAAPAEINLVGLANGAWILKRPQEYDESWSALWLLDERSQSGWATPKGTTTPQQLLIALPEQSVIRSVEFDSASVDGDEQGSRSARQVTVEVSDQGPSAGFQTVASVNLLPKKDHQRFAVSLALPGRWVRLTVRNNHGSDEYIELFDFRAYGEQRSQSAAPSLSGTYATNYGNFHLQQDGAAVSGCYERELGLIANGGVDGRVTRFTWSQGEIRGPAVLTFSPDGKELLGLWWSEGQTDATGSVWSGRKISDQVGSCPHWKGAQTASRQLAAEIAAAGRARLYGIRFDTDSDQIRPESKAALDAVVQLAREQAGWRFTIEGHTDSTASAAHNQSLSEQRARSVQAYLVAAGVAAARLSPKGLGAGQPVASNETSLGRAQNRRVELVRN